MQLIQPFNCFTFNKSNSCILLHKPQKITMTLVEEELISNTCFTTLKIWNVKTCYNVNPVIFIPGTRRQIWYSPFTGIFRWIQPIWHYTPSFLLFSMYETISSGNHNIKKVQVWEPDNNQEMADSCSQAASGSCHHIPGHSLELPLHTG